jgi:hypothetical protein
MPPSIALVLVVASTQVQRNHLWATVLADLGGPTRRRRWTRPLLAVVAVAVAACGSADTPGATATTVTRAPPGATAAVQAWLGHLVAHDDTAAFTDLAPGSQHSVGDVENYRRGSSQFSSAYSRFAPPTGTIGASVIVRADLVVVMLRFPGPPPGAAAVPVRRVGADWRVDPILGVGSYSFQPNEGDHVSSEPIFTTQLDGPDVSARVWFDDVEAVATSMTTFRPRSPLSPGGHVVTAVLLRGDDVVSRVVDLQVTSNSRAGRNARSNVHAKYLKRG